MNICVYSVSAGRLCVAVWNGELRRWLPNYSPSRVAGQRVASDRAAESLIRGTGWVGKVIPRTHPVGQLLPYSDTWEKDFGSLPKFLRSKNHGSKEPTKEHEHEGT